MNPYNQQIKLTASVRCPESPIIVGTTVKVEAQYNIFCSNNTDCEASFQVLITIQVGERNKSNKATVSLPPRGEICAKLGQEMKLEITPGGGSIYEVIATINATNSDTGENASAIGTCEFQA
jgi:hypothetical protein